MVEMSMNKVIHAAFRRDLERFVGALQKLSPGDQVRARQLGTAWANFDAQLTRHHEGEHEIAWPALQSIGVTSDVVATMDAEHEVMAAALDEARSAMDALVRDPGVEQSRAALAALERLRSVTVQHLDHEEAELEPVYLQNRDTPEMKAMGRAFGKVGPREGGQFFAWLGDGASAGRTRGDDPGHPPTRADDHRRPLRAELPEERRAGVAGLAERRVDDQGLSRQDDVPWRLAPQECVMGTWSPHRARLPLGGSAPYSSPSRPERSWPSQPRPRAPRPWPSGRCRSRRARRR